MKKLTTLIITLFVAVAAMAQPYPIIKSTFDGETFYIWNYGDSVLVISSSPMVFKSDSIKFSGNTHVNYLVVNRDSFTDPAATIASIGNNGQVVQCGFDCDTIQDLINKTALYSYTYAQAADSVAAGALVPLAWYNITDDSVYLQAVTDSTFSLNGYFADSVIWEIDAIEFDFANEHIQRRCDKRGNCVGAVFAIIDNGFISVDPISVFAWGNPFVVGNTVKDAVFDLRLIVGVGDAFVIDNQITQQSEVIVGNNGALQFNKNTVESGATWTCLFATGLIFDNQFKNEIAVNTDSVNVQFEGNEMYGSGMYYTINGSSGIFLANKGQGHLRSRYSAGCNIRDNSFFNGSYIFADSLTGDINANDLHRGSELYMMGSDSAFSKCKLDYTALVYANHNQNRSEDNTIEGCGNGLGTVFIVSMTTSGQFINNTYKSCGDTVELDDATVYNGIYSEFTRNLGIGITTLTAKLHVNGNTSHGLPLVTFYDGDNADENLTINFGGSGGIQLASSSVFLGGSGSFKVDNEFTFNGTDDVVLQTQPGTGDVYIGNSTDNKLIYKDGTQALNYVLTSDADGLATWTDPTATIYEDTAVPGNCYTIQVINGVVTPVSATCP